MNIYNFYRVFTKLAVLLFASLFAVPSSADSMIGVSNGISLQVSKDQTFSFGESETESTLLQTEEIRILVAGDKVIVKGVDTKRSILPLSDQKDYAIKSLKVARIDLPNSAKEVSFLHLYTRLLDGVTKNTCEVLTLYELLDSTERLVLETALSNQGVEYDKRNGLLVSNCRRTRK